MESAEHLTLLGQEEKDLTSNALGEVTEYGFPLKKFGIRYVVKHIWINKKSRFKFPKKTVPGQIFDTSFIG